MGETSHWSFSLEKVVSSNVLRHFYVPHDVETVNFKIQCKHCPFVGFPFVISYLDILM